MVDCKTFIRQGDLVTITMWAPMYWWDDFSQETNIVPLYHPLVLSTNTGTMFPSFDNTGVVTMYKAAIEQAKAEYDIMPGVETERRLLELLPMSTLRYGTFKINIGELSEVVDNDLLISDNWQEFKTFVKGHIGR